MQLQSVSLVRDKKEECGLSGMAVHNNRKEWKIIMRYTEFYNMFKDYLNGNQITEMQKMAFKFYKDAHGYNPMRKNQKQVAYGFLQDLFYNMESDECIE